METKCCLIVCVLIQSWQRVQLSGQKRFHSLCCRRLVWSGDEACCSYSLEPNNNNNMWTSESQKKTLSNFIYNRECERDIQRLELLVCVSSVLSTATWGVVSFTSTLIFLQWKERESGVSSCLCLLYDPVSFTSENLSAHECFSWRSVWHFTTVRTNLERSSKNRQKQFLTAVTLPVENMEQV